MSRKDDDVPLLFRPNGSAIRAQPKKGMAIFLNEAMRTLTIEGVTFSIDLLKTLAPQDGSVRGPFWVKKEGDTVAIYEMDTVEAEATESLEKN